MSVKKLKNFLSKNINIYFQMERNKESLKTHYIKLNKNLSVCDTQQQLRTNDRLYWLVTSTTPF